jgi:hypothetical protein
MVASRLWGVTNKGEWAYGRVLPQIPIAANRRRLWCEREDATMQTAANYNNGGNHIKFFVFESMPTSRFQDTTYSTLASGTSSLYKGRLNLNASMSSASSSQWLPLVQFSQWPPSTEWLPSTRNSMFSLAKTWTVRNADELILLKYL